MTTIAIVLDIIVVLVVLVFLIIGICRGFIKSIVRLLGFLASVVVSAVISSPVAKWLYELLLYDRLESAVAQKVQEGVANTAATLNEQVQAVVDSLPGFLQNLLSIYGSDTQAVSGTTQAGETLVPTIMDNVITPVCTALLQIVVFLVLFLVLFLVIRLLGKLLDAIFSKIPVIKQINGILGGVLGFAEGVLVVFVLCAAIQLYMSLAGENSFITTAHLEGTYVMQWLMSINPFI